MAAESMGDVPGRSGKGQDGKGKKQQGCGWSARRHVMAYNPR
jgi:hypothetical protein